MDVPAFDNLLAEIAGKGKRWLTFGATFGPAFRIKNFLRDTLHTFEIRKGFKLPFGKITMSANLINLLNSHDTYSYIYTYGQDGAPIRKSESLIPFFPQFGLAYEFW